MAKPTSRSDFFSQLDEAFTGEALFDCLPDLVFFIKNRRGEYVVVNQTLVERCGRREKSELIGRTVEELFPGPLASGYRAQDESVLRQGVAIRNQLEIHFHASGVKGWCLTDKLPLFDKSGGVAGLMGISKDLKVVNSRGRDYASVALAVKHIQSNFTSPLRVSHLAQLAQLSSYQFEQRIRSIFHLTVGQFIQKVRMEYAMRQLRESAAPLSRIAMDCGYSDQSAFTRQFRMTTGMTPSHYRAAAE